MTNILYAQTIWVPTEELYIKNINSLKSLAGYINSNESFNIDFVFGGWGYNEEYFALIENFIKYSIPRSTIHKFPNNFGKAHIINDIIRKHTGDYNYLYIADSDMIIDCDCFFDKLVASISGINSVRNIPFGFIAPMQQCYNCHMNNIYENSFDIANCKFHYPNGPHGIAGGSLFISRECWDKVGGYREAGVCYGEDAYFLLDTHSNGFSYQVSEDIWIHHPSETNVEYHKWKINQCQNAQLPYDLSIKSTEEYWRSK